VYSIIFVLNFTQLNLSLNILKFINYKIDKIIPAPTEIFFSLFYDKKLIFTQNFPKKFIFSDLNNSNISEFVSKVLISFISNTI